VSLAGCVGGDAPDLNRWILTGRSGAFELHDWYSLRRRINGAWLEIDSVKAPSASVPIARSLTRSMPCWPDDRTRCRAFARG
jgi:hypothetical protein